MTVEKLLSLNDFNKNPELQVEFGGDYNKYVSSFIQKLNQVGIFGVEEAVIPKMGMKGVSLFFNPQNAKKIAPQQDKKFDEIVNNLDKIDPKYRPMIEAELNNGNVYRAFVYMQIALDRSKLLGEFSEYSKGADAKAAASEKAYDLAVKAEHEAKNAREAAERHLEEMIASYDEGDYHITEAQHKLRDLITGASDATLARKFAGYQMVEASKASLRAFQNSMIADAMLGQNFT